MDVDYAIQYLYLYIFTEVRAKCFDRSRSRVIKYLFFHGFATSLIFHRINKVPSLWTWHFRSRNSMLKILFICYLIEHSVWRLVNIIRKGIKFKNNVYISEIIKEYKPY